MRRLLAVLGLVGLAAACGGESTAQSTPSPQAHALLVYTTWTPDAKVVNGPEPGYRPALTGLDGHDVVKAAPLIDPTGTVWLIDVTFTARGSALFSTLTRDNVAACPGDPSTAAASNCVQRHLTIWVNLTQADIDRWEDQTYVNQVAAPFDMTCLTQTPGVVCPKFLSDPITLEQITGGRAEIAGTFTRNTASELAAAINVTART